MPRETASEASESPSQMALWRRLEPRSRGKVRGRAVSGSAYRSCLMFKARLGALKCASDHRLCDRATGPQWRSLRATRLGQYIGPISTLRESEMVDTVCHVWRLNESLPHASTGASLSGHSGRLESVVDTHGGYACLSLNAEHCWQQGQNPVPLKRASREAIRDEDNAISRADE